MCHVSCIPHVGIEPDKIRFQDPLGHVGHGNVFFLKEKRTNKQVTQQVSCWHVSRTAAVEQMPEDTVTACMISKTNMRDATGIHGVDHAPTPAETAKQTWPQKVSRQCHQHLVGSFPAWSSTRVMKCASKFFNLHGSC
jgi:hypothetical protein